MRSWLTVLGLGLWAWVALLLGACSCESTSYVLAVGDSAAYGAAVMIDGKPVASLDEKLLADGSMAFLADSVGPDSQVVREWLYQSGDTICQGNGMEVSRGQHEVVVKFRDGAIVRETAQLKEYNTILVRGREKGLRIRRSGNS